MFQVTTLPLNELPRTEEGGVDYSCDFFGKPTALTVSGQLEGELGATALGAIYTFGSTRKRSCSLWRSTPHFTGNSNL